MGSKIKKNIAILLAASMIVTIGCQKQDANMLSVIAVQPEGKIFTDFKQLRNKRESIIVNEDFISKLDQFADASATQLLKVPNVNLSYSPVSLYLALSVLAQGSSGDTANEIFQVLGMEKVDYEELATSIDTLYQLLYRNTKVNQLKVSNAVWMDQNFPFLSSYGDIVSKRYHASIFSVDFSKSATVTTMQDWVKEATNGIIEPKIVLADSQVMTIMNTIYYANNWVDEFNEANNTTEEFYVSKEDTVLAEFLNTMNSMDSYQQGEGYKIYQMRLESGDSMIFCLPEDDQSPETLLAKFSPSELFHLKDMKAAKVILSLPKFDYGYKMNLVETIKNLGISLAFDPERADFSQISNEPLFLSNASQEVHITLDEEGVVGAAYTEISLEAGSAMPKELETIELKFNRPFLYQLRTSEGIVLFTGVVADPAQK